MMQAGRVVEGFVRAEGKKLVNGAGREIVLRGVGLGNWLLPEGYMWKFPAAGDRPRRIERMVAELIGAERAARFWKAYYDRYIAEADIRQIAAEGFNSVRLPINSRFVLESDEPWKANERHLRLIDRLLGWCRAHGLYVILDLHGAPGGQTGANIDDSERDLPELFMHEANKRRTVRLWRMLAERYRDEWIVAGYDLLNEPLPDRFAEYNADLMPLYAEITKAIREVDERHLIVLEGAHWATDWSVFGSGGFGDDNVMLQFHKYWNEPDVRSIQPYLDKREMWSAPIFMGEGGENADSWYAAVFQLLEEHEISWNFWPWKKLACTNSPCSIRTPRGWERLTGYLEGGPAPEADEAERILDEWLENIRFKNVQYRREVAGAIFRR